MLEAYLKLQGASLLQQQPRVFLAAILTLTTTGARGNEFSSWERPASGRGILLFPKQEVARVQRVFYIEYIVSHRNRPPAV